MRIVSLTCSNTEIVCALGCSELLVGVDQHSDYPEEVVASLPRVGPDLGIDIEQVAALKPDLVLASLTVPGHEEIVAGLAEAGLPYLAPEPISLSDVYRDIGDIAEALGVPTRGEAVVGQMREVLGQGPTPSTPGPSLLVQWWPKPTIAPGRLSWVHDMIKRAGGSHPLEEEEVKSRPLSDREVLSLAPDAIVLSWCGATADKVNPEVIYRKQAWRSLEALQRRRVFLIPEAYMGRPSPRLVEGFRQLKAIVAQLHRR